MSVKRIVAVMFIFIGSCAAWWVLGSVTAFRSRAFDSRLGYEVQMLWGSPITQAEPSLSVAIPGTDRVRWVMPSKSDIDVTLNLDHRKKGLIWYPTYECKFNGIYEVRNDEEVAQQVTLKFDFPNENGTYDNFGIYLNGENIKAPVDTKEGIAEIIEIKPGEQQQFRITYTTRGISEWRYKISENVGRAQNLNLEVATNFKDIDFTSASRAPETKEKTKKGMLLTWEASDLITSQDMGIIMPEKINPGPLTTRITFFAPVCLLFFFVLVASINILFKVNIHPMHYFFVATGFFAFHLLLSYMAGLVPIAPAFMISAVTSVTMVTSYLSGALRGKFPWKIAAAGQLFFLVLFSYSFFFKGITGLIVAIGCVATLAVLMKVTAQVDWNDVFTKKKNAPNLPPIPAS